MTREEFTTGWILWTAQPWGRWYDGRQEPEKTRIQFDLYYQALHWATVDAWRTTALRYAGGSEWPSLEEVKRSLTQENGRHTMRLAPPDPSQPLTKDEQAFVEKKLSELLGRPFTLNNPD